MCPITQHASCSIKGLGKKNTVHGKVMSEMQQQQEEAARQAGSAVMRKAVAAHITHISHQLHCPALLMWWAMWTSTVLRNHLCCVFFSNNETIKTVRVPHQSLAAMLRSALDFACICSRQLVVKHLALKVWESCPVHVVQRWAESCAIRAWELVFGWLSRMCWLLMGVCVIWSDIPFHDHSCSSIQRAIMA